MSARAAAAGGGARRAAAGAGRGGASRSDSGPGLWYEAVGLSRTRAPQTAPVPQRHEPTHTAKQRPRQSTPAQPRARVTMTATALAYEPSVAPRPRRSRPPRQAPQPLQVVRRRSRVRFTTLGLTLLIAVLIAAALAGPMLLNVAGMRIDWRLAQLESRQDTLVSERASLSTQAAALGSTPRIMEEAQKLGMEPAARVNYVVLPGGDLALQTASAGGDGGETLTAR
jgi:cell division protein FtsL